MIYLTTDENKYLLSVATVGRGIEADIDLKDYDLSGDRIRAHKWENDTLIFDADKYAEIQTEKQKEEETKPERENDTVTWAELDAAYNEGRDTAYDQ